MGQAARQMDLPPPQVTPYTWVPEPHPSLANQPKFSLTPDQDRALDVLGGPQTHTNVFGGSRSGKTFLIVRSIVSRAMRGQESRHLIARFRGNAVRASVWLDTFPKVMRLCYPTVVTKTYRQDGFEEFPVTGAQIWFGGLDEKDRVEKILGNEYATIYPGECSQISYDSILILRTRLAQNVPGLALRGFYDLNPTSTMHWTHKEFIEKVDPITGLPLANPDDYAYVQMNPAGNAANLPESYLRALQNMPQAYRDRFWRGEYIKDIEGALWTTDLLELRRVEPYDPQTARLGDLRRIVVGVDPSGASSKNDIKSDDIGIVAAGLTHADKGVVLEDASMKGSPKEWARAAVACYKKWKADVVVAEANYGGEMVRNTIQAVDGSVPVKLVTATRGKVVRAEPVAALYEEDRARMAGHFPLLEDQLKHFSTSGYKGDRSPDRADAAIWALTELLLGTRSRYTLAGVR